MINEFMGKKRNDEDCAGSVSAISQKVNYARISAEWNLSPPKENTADGCALNVGRDVLIRPQME